MTRPASPVLPVAETNVIPFPMGELQIRLPECLRAQVEQGVLVPIEEEDKEKDAPAVGVQRARKSFPFRTGRMTTVPKALRAVLVGGRTPGGALHRSSSPYFVPTHAQLRRNQRRFRRSLCQDMVFLNFYFDLFVTSPSLFMLLCSRLCRDYFPILRDPSLSGQD